MDNLWPFVFSFFLPHEFPRINHEIEDSTKSIIKNKNL